MDVLLAILAFVLSALGIVGCIVPVLPGVVLGYIGLLCAWGASYSQISAATLWLWLALTIAVSAADYFLPAWMTRRFGGSRAGAIGATIGVFAGFILFPPWGIVLGPFAGAVAGELLHDSTDSGKAFRVGFGSFMAFIVGTGLKLIACLTMFVLVAADVWTPFKEWVSGLF
ncbi:MAG: DUF456 domain-containing protein [Alistipes sp.]|nr:DUF456 domain-containing protein [Alistipes sp.]